MTIGEIAEEKIKMINELQNENYRGGEGRVIYLDSHGNMHASPPAKAPPAIVPRYVDALGNLVIQEYSPQPNTKEIVVGKITPVQDSSGAAKEALRKRGLR